MRETLLAYGPDESQIIRCSHHNTSDGRKQPVVVLVHGGFWKHEWNMDNALLNHLVPFFLSKNFVVCELEYRRGQFREGGGGYPRTNNDIIVALTKLHEFANEKSDVSKVNLDMSQVIIIGHSAGGHLALYACSSGIIEKLPFRPLACIAVAPIGDLVEGCMYDCMKSRIENYMGHTLDNRGSVAALKEALIAYSDASPACRLPLQTKSLIVKGAADTDVPGAHVDRFYAACVTAAEEHNSHNCHQVNERLAEDPLNGHISSEIASVGVSGGDSIGGAGGGGGVTVAYKPTFLEVPNADHYQLVDSKSDCWSVIYEQIIAVSGVTNIIPH